MLERDIGHVAVVDGVGRAGGDTHHNLFYLIRLEGLALVKIFHCIKWRLDWTTRRPLFQRGFGHSVDLAELIDQTRGVGLGVVRLYKIVGPGENVVDACPAGVNHECCMDAVTRSHGAEKKTFFDMVRVASPGTDAGAGLLRGIIQQPAHLLGIQTGGATGSGGRAHGSHQVVCFLHSRTDRLHGPHRDVISQRHSPHEMGPTYDELFAGSQGGGHESAPGMGSSGGEVIIGFVGVSKLTVRECRLDRSTEDIGGDHGGDLFAPVRSSELNRQTSGREIRSRHHGGNGVENVMLCLLHHMVRQGLVTGVGHVDAELLHDRADALASGRRQCYARKRRSGGH